MLQPSDVTAAAARLAGVAHRTPVLTSRTLDERTGARVWCKAECFQRVGAFKFRGAYNAVASLEAATRARGVVAYSSGNHAQAVALAAALLGTRAVIVMPDDAPEAKLAATRAYGAEVVTYDRAGADREALAAQIAAERGLHVVPPYDDERVMAGQGTVALELLEDTGELDVLVVPVSGGGLIAGCATVARDRFPGMRVVGVEPEAGDDTRQSLATGRRVRVALPATIADGLANTMPGAVTFPVVQRLVETVVCVSDAEIVQAMAFAFDRMKVVLEPSGAVALAAVLTGRLDVRGLRAGVVLSGGNVGTGRFCELLGPGGGRRGQAGARQEPATS